MKQNSNMNAMLIEVVDNQLEANDPPETRKTFERLKSEGYSEKEAKELIGSVVNSEIIDVLKQQKPFNPSRFAKALNRLPRAVGKK